MYHRYCIYCILHSKHSPPSLTCLSRWGHLRTCGRHPWLCTCPRARLSRPSPRVSAAARATIIITTASCSVPMCVCFPQIKSCSLDIFNFITYSARVQGATAVAQEPCPGKIVTTATTVHILPAPCTIPGTVRGHSSKTGGAFVIVNNYCAFKTPGSEIDNTYQPGHFIWLDTYLLPTYLDEFQKFKRDYHFGSSMVLTQMITPTINIHLQKICTI